MPEDKSILDDHLPFRFLTGTIVLTTFVLLWLGWSSYRAYNLAKTANDLSAQAHRLQGKILHLDEVLTMSARMRAATGDLMWEERYRFFEPQLDAAIKEAIQIAPEVISGKAAKQTDAANIVLVQMENASFELVRQGRNEEAKNILFGEEYEKQKRIYAQGIQEFTAHLIGSVNKSIEARSQIAYFDISTMVIALVVLVLGWGLVLRMVRRWEKIILEKNQLLLQRSIDLSDLNNSLDAKVKERTRELESSRIMALEMAEQAHQAEAEMRVSEERSRSIIETANDAFVSIDEAGAITQWNHRAETAFGWSRQEILGKNLAQTIIPSEYREAHRKGMEHYLKTQEGPVLGRTVELPALHRDGRIFPIEITIWANRVQERHQFNAFVRDISERKEAEKKLRETFEQLQKAHDELKQAQLQLLQSEKLASIGQLAAGVAHEINNPVGFISNNMEILQEYIKHYAKIVQMMGNLKREMEDGDIEKAKLTLFGIKKFEEDINLDYIMSDVNTLMEHSGRGLERIKKIVMDLRTFAREENVETREFMKVEEVIDSILSIVQNELKYKAELIKEYGDTVLVKGSPQRLGQVFVNLLVNASQAIEEKGKITIKTYRRNKYVCVDVTDTGRGIPPDNLKKIFDPFFTTKPVGQGTGLGLSVSYEIVKKHGGEIKVTSKEGEGTTFTVMLPIEEKKM